MKYSKIFVYISILSLFYANLEALNPEKNLNEFLIKTWTTSSGLPNNTITAILQTQNGYIWLGTPSGLVRFDGVKFRTFTRWNTPILENDRIMALFEDQKNTLWIGTDGGGLYSFQNGDWKKYTSQDGLSNNYIKSITGDLQGNLWVGTEYGLNRLNMDGIQTYTTNNGLYDNIITSLDVDSWGNIWVGTLRGGLAQLNEKIIHVYDYDDGLLNNSVYAVHVDHIGNIWIGSLEGLYYLKPLEGSLQLIPGTVYTPVTSIIQDDEGSLWIGTMVDGLKRLVNEKITNYTSDHGFPDDYLRCILSDRDGDIWIGTDTGGLIQLKETTIKNITKGNGLPENAVSALLQDSEENVWIGMRNSGLCKMKDNQILKIIDKNSGLSSNRVRVIYEDDEGSLWIGTEGGGLNRLINGQIFLFSRKYGLTSNNVTAILQDHTKAIWIGTDNYLNRYSNGRIYVYNRAVGLTDEYIRILLESREGVIYAGTRGGLFKLSGNSFIQLNSENQNSNFDAISLYEDSDSTLWIGTNGSGLKRWQKGEMISFTEEDGLYDNYILSITEDETGYLWMSSYNGIFKIKSKQLDDYIKNKISRITSTFYDEADGMASSQCSGLSQPSCFKSKSGQLYYPTTKGVSILNPDDFIQTADPPEVIIEDILADEISVISKEKISISYPCEKIAINFTALDFSAPKKIRYIYKLEGYDSEFIDVKPGRTPVADYLNIAPGNYRFIAKAINNAGIWSEKETVLEFEVLSPIYMKPIFYVILLVIVLLIGGNSIYVKHKKKLKKQLDKYKTSALDPERADEIVPKLIKLLEKDRLFLNPDLTLVDLSQKLNIHYNYLSRIINERFRLSYNDFINKYRIEEVKQRLSDLAMKKQTVLEIMYDTGFYSKSVFNTAFKKFTGLTPSEYRKKHS